MGPGSEAPTIYDYLNLLQRVGPEAAAAEIARGRVAPEPKAPAPSTSRPAAVKQEPVASQGGFAL